MNGNCAEAGRDWRTSSYSGPTGDCVEAGRGWRKSSYSDQTNCVETGNAWRKSSYSGPNADCVEAGQAGGVLVRDTKDRGGPVLAVTPDAWRAFIAGLKG